jgi:hypothetical protein
MTGLPAWATISMIEPSPFDASTAFVVVDAHRLDDMHPYLYKTADFGRSWTRLDAKLADNVYLHAVREDPARPGLLYLGTERGVMFSTDGGASWRSLKLNLPTVAVHDLGVKGHDLVVGTHGRSVWILDDLQPVREFDAKVAASAVHLFPVADAVRWRKGTASWAARHARYPDPPYGAAIYYYLRDKAKGPLTIEILDAQRRIVRTLSSVAREPDGSADNEDPEDLKKQALPTGAGVQRAVWNLAWEGATKIKGAKIDTGDPADGPLAVPGSYTVRMTVDGHTLTSPLRVLADPRGSLSQTDLETQLAYALRVRDGVSKLTGLVTQVRSIREQLQARVKSLDVRKSEPPVAELITASEATIARATALEDRLHNPTAEVVYDILAMRGGTRLYSRLAPLLMWANDADGLPTVGMTQVLDEQEKELGQLDREARGFFADDVAQLNRMAARLGLGFVLVR